MIPLSEPYLGGNEWKYVKDCLDTGWVSYVGSYVNVFERKVADYVGVKYAIACINGTSALHISLLACGVSFRDEVIVPALTFIAPVNTVRYCRAQPVFIDCDEKTFCIDIEKLSDFLRKDTFRKKDGFTYNKLTKKRIKAIIPVHLFGHPVDMDMVLKLREDYNIDVIEDATESLGSKYKNKSTGSFGRAGCFSFNGNKIITTGGGGMVVTGDEALAGSIRHLITQAKSDCLEYNHDQIGYNYRLSNIQAAMGVAQMEQLGRFIQIKRSNAAIYRELLSDIEGLNFIWEMPWAKSNFWFYAIQFNQEHKMPLMEHLISRKIQVRPVWKLINTLPMYRRCQAYRIETAYKVYATCLNLPCGVGLKRGEIEFVVKGIKEYFQN